MIGPFPTALDRQCALVECGHERAHAAPLCPEHWVSVPPLVKRAYRDAAAALTSDPCQLNWASYIGAIMVACEHAEALRIEAAT